MQGGRVVWTASALEAAKKLFDGVPKESVAIVLSAQHSMEDNWAMRELGLVLFGAKTFYWSGLPEGYSDDILIHQDKNPNTVGIKQLKGDAKPFSSLVDDVRRGTVTHVLGLGGVIK